MKASVIIPCRAGKIPEELIQDLLNQQNVDFEILLIENPKHEPTLNPRFSLEPRVRFFAAHPAGANRARQMGARYAKGEIFVFVDDDVRIPDQLWLLRHVQTHQNRPEMAAIGGPYRAPENLNEWGQAYHELQEKWLRCYRKEKNETFHLLGGNWSVKKKIFDFYKFDVDIVFGGTETELQLQLWRGGYRMLFVPDLIVHHGENLSLFELIKKGFAQGVGFAYLQRRFERPAKMISWSSLGSRPSKGEFYYGFAFQAGKLFHEKSGAMTFAKKDIARGFYQAFVRRFKTRLRRLKVRFQALWFNLGQMQDR